jgi:predicted dehydrogenase
MASKARIGVGLIGLGNSGWYYHAEGTLQKSEQFDLVAVSGRTAERTDAASRAFGANAHHDWRHLIEDPRVDLVVVATPHDLHHPMAVAAASAGKHVVVEKPMSNTTEEAREMIATAKLNNVVLSVFQNRRWEQQYQAILGMVRDGSLGRVWRIEERRMHRGKYTVSGANSPHSGTEPASWAHTTQQGGGVTYLISPHLIDHQLQLFGSDPLDVSAVMHTFPEDAVEHYADIRMTFPGGALSRVEIYREAIEELPSWVVVGDGGTAVGPDLRTLRIRRNGRELELLEDLPQLRECDVFYEQLYLAINNGAPPPVDPLDSAKAVRVIELAHQSARSGGDRQAFSF